MNSGVQGVKQKILNYISERGPSLPAHLTKVSDMNLTFTSALLSELLQERKLKTSNLKVGSSPLYFVPGQQEKLEKFIDNLKDPEIEAFNKLKQNKILDDEQQNSVLRVALRSIRDFAFPLKHKNKLYWKFYSVPDDKASVIISGGDEKATIGGERIIGQQIWDDIQKENVSREMVEKIIKKHLQEIKTKNQDSVQDKEITADIAETTTETSSLEKESLIENNKQEKLQEIQPEKIQETTPSAQENVEKDPEKIESNEKFNDIEIQEKPKPVKKTAKKKKISQKDLFLEQAKDTLKAYEIEILDVLKYDSNKLIARVKRQQEFLLIFSKKKRMEEKEILRDLKKVDIGNLEVEIIFDGEPSKKVQEKINFFSKIRKIGKIQEQ